MIRNKEKREEMMGKRGVDREGKTMEVTTGGERKEG